MNSPVEVVEAINAAWRTGRTDDLASSFAPEMLIVGPGYLPLAHGSDACIASYRDFLRASVTHEYSQSEVTVHEVSDLAVVTYRWEMDYEQRGRRSREEGTDLFVLRREADRWRAVTFAAVNNPAG